MKDKKNVIFYSIFQVADKESDLMGGQAVPPSDRTSFVVNKRDDRPAKSSSDSDVRAAGEPMKSPRAVNSPVPKLREERVRR